MVKSHPEGIKNLIRQSSALSGLVEDARRVMGSLRHRSKHGRDGRTVAHYLQQHPVAKLQIGSGPTTLHGWLSTDLRPRTPKAVFLDATKPFRFDDATFDYVYSEHMIEHVNWQHGLSMLRECLRVLKPGGTLRIATPDLKVLMELYDGPKGPTAERYIQWITDTFLDRVQVYKPAFVINNAFANWGHTFIYDAELMRMALTQTGFADIRQLASDQSDDDHLRGVESHGKNIADNEMAAFETMVFEARKPR